MHDVVQQNKSSTCQYACCRPTTQITKVSIACCHPKTQITNLSICMLPSKNTNHKLANMHVAVQTHKPQTCQHACCRPKTQTTNLSIIMTLLSSKNTNHKLVNMHVVVQQNNKLPTSHCHPLIQSNQFV